MSLAGYKRAHGPSLEACLGLQCICIVWLLLNLTCTTITCQLLVCYTPLKAILPNMSSETLNSKSLVEVCIALFIQIWKKCQNILKYRCSEEEAEAL